MKQLKEAGRAAGVVVIGAAAYMFTQFQGGFVSWFIFYMLLPFIAYSLLLSVYPLRDFTVRRDLSPAQLTRGGDMTVRLQISRKWPFPLLYVVLTDYRVHAGSEGCERRIILWGFRRHYNMEYTVPSVARGEYVLPAVEIEAADFFNWIRKRRQFLRADSFLVYPKFIDFALPSVAKGDGDGEKVSAFIPAQDALMPSGVRKYTSGDKMSWIHWKTFARTNELMTKEFDEQQSERFIVLLDGAAAETFESVVDVTASVIAASEQRQENSTLMIAGDAPALYTDVQFESQMRQALIHLAKIQPSSESILLPVRRMDQSSALLIITGNLRPAWIRRVLELYPKPPSIRCFVIVKNRRDEAFKQAAADVRRLGITVQVIEQSAADRAVEV